MKALIKLFCLSIILCASCKDNNITSASQVIFPDSGVSYKKHVKPFLNLTCTYQGCHAKASPASGIALVDYNDLFFGAATLGLIVEYKPESSRLYQVINGDQPHMDSFQKEINDNHKKGIRTWILEGAKLN